MDRYRTIGKPAPRSDGWGKVTGSAIYAADTPFPEALWARALRSPYPHAKIESIDTSEALKVPGVVDIITGHHTHGVRFGRRLLDVPVLAEDRVRFIGERVALVAAETAEAAHRAADQIRVQYDELEAVFDPIEAMKSTAPLLHPNLNDYVGLPRPVADKSNVLITDWWGVGDVQAGFADADLIIEGTYSTERVHQGYLEPHNCLVWIDDEGRLQVWAPNKAPHRLKHDLALALGLPEEMILVHFSTIGADFGGKGSPMDMPACYFLARKTRKPIRMIMDYSEELAAANPRHGSFMQMKTGVKKTGEIVAHEARLIFNSGAYGGFKPVPGVNLPGASHAGGPYSIPNCSIEALIVYTNTVPCGFFRGPGAVQANFALESHIDVIAGRLGLDPIMLRSLNLAGTGGILPSGSPTPHMSGRQTLDAIATESSFQQHRDAGVGKGIALAYKDQGEGQSAAAVELHPDGRIVVKVSVFEQGTGSYTVFQQIAAEVLGQPLGAVEVSAWNTDESPFDTGVGASRVTRVAAPAVYEAATQARNQLLAIGADLTGWPVEECDLADNLLLRMDTGERIPWTDLVSQRGSPVEGYCTNTDFEESPLASFMAQMAEVHVDRETGKVSVLRLTSVHEVGQIYNPIGHQGQINGGVIQGLGQAVSEELRADQGRVECANLADYKMLSCADVPELATVLVPDRVGLGPYSAKGIGEYSLESVPAAVANAVADAIGIRITDLPITAEKVYAAIKKHQ